MAKFYTIEDKIDVRSDNSVTIPISSEYERTVKIIDVMFYTDEDRYCSGAMLLRLKSGFNEINFKCINNKNGKFNLLRFIIQDIEKSDECWKYVIDLNNKKVLKEEKYKI